jgi:hypothetical protein
MQLPGLAFPSPTDRLTEKHHRSQEKDQPWQKPGLILLSGDRIGELAMSTLPYPKPPQWAQFLYQVLYQISYYVHQTIWVN